MERKAGEREDEGVENRQREVTTNKMETHHTKKRFVYISVQLLFPLMMAVEQ